jgi:hypothetical protein
MDQRVVVALAQIVAAQARIEGMKAANQQRLTEGASIAYDEQAFLSEAAGLEFLAQHLQNL